MNCLSRNRSTDRGNHIWDRKEILDYFPATPAAAAANFADINPGSGLYVGTAATACLRRA